MKRWMKSIGRFQVTPIKLALWLLSLRRPQSRRKAPPSLGSLATCPRSTLYADNSGQGSAVAALMAVDYFRGEVLGCKNAIVAGDHQIKSDVGSAIARRWLDNEGDEVSLDVPNVAVALTVQGITDQSDLAPGGGKDPGIPAGGLVR